MKAFVSSTALVAAFLALPVSAADPLSNSYWDVAYIHSDVDGSFTATSGTTTLGGTSSDTAEGFRLALSVGFSRYVALVADYDQRRDGGTRSGIGSAGLSLHSIDRALQPYLTATYERDEYDDNTDPSADDVTEGWGAEGGVRWALSNLELGAFYKYIDYADSSDFTDRKASRYGVLAGLQLSPQWALTAQYRMIKDEESGATTGASVSAEAEVTDYTVGFRRYFATDFDRLKRKGGVLFGPDE